MKKLFSLCFGIAILLCSQTASPASYTVDRFLVVCAGPILNNSQNYTVLFGEGTNDRGFWPNNNLDFLTQTEATSASDALTFFLDNNPIPSSSPISGIEGIPVIPTNTGKFEIVVPFEIISSSISDVLYDALVLQFFPDDESIFSHLSVSNQVISAAEVTNDQYAIFAKFAQIPEPSLLSLLTIGMIGLFGFYYSRGTSSNN